MSRIREYKLFTERLYEAKRTTFSILIDIRFWAGFFFYLSGSNSSLPKIIKLFFIIILRFLFGIETTTRCKVISIPYFPHPRNIVNGAAEIGSYVIIYHNVTIGAKRVDIGFSKRPIIGDYCVLATGAIIIGKGIINSNSILSANSITILD